MIDATSNQIATTLANMRQEVSANGISEAASDMWLHALSMYRKHKLNEEPHAQLPDESQLSMFLRPQAG